MRRGRQVTLPVLIVLLAFLGGAGYLVWRAHDGTVGGDGGGALGSAVDGDPLEAGAGEGAWRHHDWGAAETAPAAGSGDSPERPPGTPRDSETIPPPAADDEDYDPQMWAMRRSFRMQADGGMPLPFSPSEHEASIVESEGELGVAASASCEVRVLPVRTPRFNCLARVVCGGRVLYPNPTQTAGYVPCEIQDGEAVSAVDDGHTALDGDPLIRFDLQRGTVTVEDRGDGVAPFRATLRIGRRRS